MLVDVVGTVCTSHLSEAREDLWTASGLSYFSSVDSHSIFQRTPAVFARGVVSRGLSLLSEVQFSRVGDMNWLLHF